MTYKPFQVMNTSIHLDSSEVNALLTAQSALQAFKQHYSSNYPGSQVDITFNNGFSSERAAKDQNLILAIAPSASASTYKMLEIDSHIKMVFENHKHTHWIIVAEAASPNLNTSVDNHFPTYSEAHEGLRWYLQSNYDLAVLRLTDMPEHPIALHKFSGVHYNPYVIKLKRTRVGTLKISSSAKPAPSTDARTRVLSASEEHTNMLLLPVTEIEPLLIRDTGEILPNSRQNILYPKTVNFIQGKSGTHKSRFAGELVSGLLTQPDQRNPLNFRLNPGFNRDVSVLYVDTERNISDQFRGAMQTILQNAGCSPGYEKFRVLSFVEFPRKDRIDYLKLLIEEIRRTNGDHLVVCTDVITDLVQNFNEPQQCMELVDYQNQLVNLHDVTFVNVIHENPNSDKARGHLGTELHNKASTVLQINHRGNMGDTNLYEVNFKKQRCDAPYKPFAIKYCNETKGLQLATEEAVQLKNQQGKASVEDVCALLPSILVEPKNRRELLDELMERFDCAERTIEATIKIILEQKRTIVDEDAVCYHLHKTKGKSVQYELIPE